MTVPPPGALPLTIFGWVVVAASIAMQFRILRRYRRGSRDRTALEYEAFARPLGIWTAPVLAICIGAGKLVTFIALTPTLGITTTAPLITILICWVPFGVVHITTIARPFGGGIPPERQDEDWTPAG